MRWVKGASKGEGGLLRREGWADKGGKGAPDRTWWRMVQRVLGPTGDVMEVLRRGQEEGGAEQA